MKDLRVVRRKEGENTIGDLIAIIDCEEEEQPMAGGRTDQVIMIDER